MVDILGFIEELKHIKDLLCKGKLLAKKETYDVLKVVNKLIIGYEKQVEDFEKAHAPKQLELEFERKNPWYEYQVNPKNTLSDRL